MVKKYLLDLASTSDFLELVAVGLMGTEIFYTFVRDEILTAFTTESVKEIVRKEIAAAVSQQMSKVLIAVGDNDILIIPSDGVSGRDFERLAAMMPPSKNIGIISADDVKILRLT